MKFLNNFNVYHYACMRDNSDHMEPKERWQKIIEGDQSSFELFFEEEYARLMVFGLQIYFDRSLVKDCIQDVFLEIWNKRQRLPVVNNHSAYLKQILKRKLLKATADNFKIKEGNPSRPKSFLSYETQLIQQQKEEEVRKKLQKAFQSLTARQKEIIELRFFQELSYEEIAERTSSQKRTIYNQVHSALKILKQSMLIHLFFFMH